MSTPRERIRKAYDPGLFAQAAAQISELLSAKLRSLEKPPYHTLDWTAPRELLQETAALLSPGPSGDLPARIGDLAKKYISKTNGLQSPHYIGHQVPAPVPVAAAFEMIGSCLNQPSGIYEMGPFSAAAEKALVTRLGEKLGWNAGTFDGIATHGGSLANFTALLAARNHHLEGSWEEGIRRIRGNPAILASADCHYSVSRAAAMIGLGAKNVIKAPLDSKRRMNPERARQAINAARENGQEVFCIVGSACATPIGAFDPLDELAALAKENRAWFHVDAAHGAPLLFSETHRFRLKGIEKADSITWDAHKMMFVPALCTFLLYRDKVKSYLPFKQDAPYLFDRSAESTSEFDSALRTVECTKRPLVMGLWSVWSLFGERIFADLVDVTIESAREFHAILSEEKDFRPAHDPECNIVCFSYLPEFTDGADPERISEFQMALRKAIVQAGNFYVTGTRLDGQGVLRVSVMNPLTEKEHFVDLLEHIRGIGRKTWDALE